MTLTILHCWTTPSRLIEGRSIDIVVSNQLYVITRLRDLNLSTQVWTANFTFSYLHTKPVQTQQYRHEVNNNEQALRLGK